MSKKNVDTGNYQYAETLCTLSFANRVFLKEEMLFNYKKNRAWAENVQIIMQIGLTMAGCIIFCLFVGIYIDKWLGIKGIFTTIFTILGVIGGGNVVYRQILEVTEQDKENKKITDNGDS